MNGEALIGDNNYQTTVQRFSEIIGASESGVSLHNMQSNIYTKDEEIKSSILGDYAIQINDIFHES